MYFKGTKIYNSRPRNYAKGGYINKRSNMTRRQLTHDSIRAIVMPNELVIPVQYTPLVVDFLKAMKIKLPHM